MPFIKPGPGGTGVRCHANFYIKQRLESRPFRVNYIHVELLGDHKPQTENAHSAP